MNSKLIIESLDRGMPFPDIIGQTTARQALLKALSRERLAHAYLFAGPTGSGRSALALELARALNCREGLPTAIFSPCQCPDCRMIRRWQHPHLIPVFPLPSSKPDKGAAADQALMEILQAKSGNPYAPIKLAGSGEILVEYIRGLRNILSLAPDQQGIRTIIIQPADAMNLNSSNALLKLLEEPPDRCCLVLITDTPKSMPPTVLSRCQIIRFQPLGVEEIKDALIKQGKTDPQKAELIARLSFGSFTRALELAHEERFALRQSSLDYLRVSALGHPIEISAFVEQFTQNHSRQEMKELLSYAKVWIRDALLKQASTTNDQNSRLINIDNLEVSERMAGRYQAAQLTATLCQIEEMRLAVDSNVIPSIALTALAIQIYRILK
ncbi:MAG: AAA family ATPase [Calditrichota bacterium]